MTDTPKVSPTAATVRLDDAQRPKDATRIALDARYEVGALVGSGGMGKVYRARDRETNEIIAIKVLLPEIAADPAMTERFKNELRLSRRISPRSATSKKAVHWMQRAAESNHADAQFALGKMYERGRGVPKDVATARQWYERAAAAGHAQARRALARARPRP